LETDVMRIDGYGTAKRVEVPMHLVHASNGADVVIRAMEEQGVSLIEPFTSYVDPEKGLLVITQERE
jgi:hypothetical protein